MRLDLLLVRLRFARSRTVAQRWIAEGHIRLNGNRVTRADRVIAAGDVLTLPVGNHVEVVRISTLPDRRGPASEAQSCYLKLDAGNSLPIAGCTLPLAGEEG